MMKILLYNIFRLFPAGSVISHKFDGIINTFEDFMSNQMFSGQPPLPSLPRMTVWPPTLSRCIFEGWLTFSLLRKLQETFTNFLVPEPKKFKSDPK